jgi:uncharacterized protein
MKLFTPQEKKKLTALFDRAADPEETLTLDALHGFLYGLAIIPQPIMPSEWLPIVFGKQMLKIDSAAETQELLAPLFAVYNRIMTEHKRGEFDFPFDMEKLKKNELAQIGEWANGLYCAMYLRPSLWGMDRDEDEELTEDEEEVLASCGIIMGIAMPEELPNMYESEEEMNEEEEAERLALLFALLPSAVRNIQKYAETGKLDDMPIDDDWILHDQPYRNETIGRNAPCPCGSGKKYRKCCGTN